MKAKVTLRGVPEVALTWVLDDFIGRDNLIEMNLDDDKKEYDLIFIAPDIETGCKIISNIHEATDIRRNLNELYFQ